ncbi:IucA/IucC family protein [Halobacillus litoralis]|uniref:IucA/IucC family protein n=1 Tax=Halobacillus litoralis TaxID=45668 RepID=UPI001CFE0E70|nr:IucA/IucC family protein [Halobacillus litoralis]
MFSAAGKIRKDFPTPVVEEEKCLQFLQEHHPSLVPVFLRQKEKGRTGILCKLADSVLRENIEGMYDEAEDVQMRGGVIWVDGKHLSTEPIHQTLSAIPLDENLTYKLIHRDGYALLFAIRSEYAFRMVETTGEILYIDHRDSQGVSSAAELVELLFHDRNFPNFFPFIHELNNGTSNLTLAYLFDEIWKEEVKQDGRRLEADSLLEYLEKKQKENGVFSPSLFFEQLVVEGHHLHPGAKTKLDLSYEDVFRYSPEFHQSYSLRFVAVRRECIAVTDASIDIYYRSQRDAAHQELLQYGLDPEQFYILPAHPWQFENAIPSIYQQEIQAGEVVLLHEPRMEVEATSSFRTVAPVQDGPVLKLAVNSQMTSTVRSISSQTALNSTVFTSLIQSVMERENKLKGFVPLNELGGAAFRSSDDLKSRNLTMLLREDIDDVLEEGEIAVAGMALYAGSPYSDQTVLKDFLDHYAREEKRKPDAAAGDFFQEYIETVLPGYLTLMVKYGIALEGHLQNSIPVFRNGRISRFFFRDWGGARIYTDRLRKQRLSPVFAPDSVSVTNKRSEMHNKLYYTVFQNHLGEMIRQLVQYSGKAEEVFWEQVKKLTNKLLDTLALDEEITDQVEEDREFLYQSTVMHKSLTKMRLTGSKSYGYSEVPNPLAGEKAAEE